MKIFRPLPFCYLLICVLLAVVACKEDDPLPEPPVDEQDDLLDYPYNPEAYELEYPNWLGMMDIPADNPMTVAGVALGRQLFFDPILSADSTMSCGSCHNPALSFQDNLPLSPGIHGQVGTRNTMALVNIGFINHGLHWDGHFARLEDQAANPILNELELADNWPNIMAKFRRHPDYPRLFRAAFGIPDRDSITSDLTTKALAQFERTLISYNSKYDKIRYGTGVFYEEDEARGRDLFFFELAITLDHPGCSHCHGGPQFSAINYFNNGLTFAESLDEFADNGRGDITQLSTDNGKFRAPTLRNIALTAPYMHDGRFATLEDVLDHYASGGHPSPNVDPNIKPFTMTEQDKADLIAFLHTLTDTAFVNNPAFRAPE